MTSSERPDGPTQPDQRNDESPDADGPDPTADTPVPRREALDQLFRRAAKAAADRLDRGR